MQPNNFAAMVDHVAVINKRIDESPLTRQEIADKLEIRRSTLYNRANNPDFDKQNIALIGWAIDYDFSIDFKQLKGYHFNFNNKQYVVGEQQAVYKPLTKNEQLEGRIEQLEKRQLQTDKLIKRLTEQNKILNDTILQLIKSIN